MSSVGSIGSLRRTQNKILASRISFSFIASIMPLENSSGYPGLSQRTSKQEYMEIAILEGPSLSVNGIARTVSIIDRPFSYIAVLPFIVYFSLWEACQIRAFVPLITLFRRMHRRNCCPCFRNASPLSPKSAAKFSVKQVSVKPSLKHRLCYLQTISQKVASFDVSKDTFIPNCSICQVPYCIQNIISRVTRL